MISNSRQIIDKVEETSDKCAGPTAAQADHTVAKLFAALFVCCVWLTLLVGDIGFQGDDWWVFSWPFWHGFGESVWLYAKESLRPVEGAYWITVHKSLGFHRQAFHFLSLTLSAGACLAMGACLLRAFPDRRDLVILAVFLAFLLPTASSLTYMIHTDNSRLSLLLFWASALLFQRWAAVSGSWLGLVWPVLLYVLAALTYENATLLVFAVPFFVWPVYVRSGAQAWDYHFLLRIGAAVCTAFALFILIRFMLFSGGAVGHRFLTPPVHLFMGYVLSLSQYLISPFSSISSDWAAWLWGTVAAGLAGYLLFHGRSKPYTGQDIETKPFGSLYVAGLGVIVLVLGMLPYLLAGYTAEVGFTSQSRVYSSGTCGLAILIALAATFWRSARARRFAQGLAVMCLLFMGAFLADLRTDWRKAADQRRSLCGQLLAQAPDVEPGTTFLFLDLQSYIDKRAVIMQGTDGLNEFIKMLYGKRSVNAYFLYPYEDGFKDAKGRTATASDSGIVPRGRLSSDPIPAADVLLFRRIGSELVLVDCVTSREQVAAIKWQGVSSICSNRERILRRSERYDPFREACAK
jgi:hypothetical protein